MHVKATTARRTHIPFYLSLSETYPQYPHVLCLLLNLLQRDTTVAPVRRWRRCFEYQDIYFQLDEFEDDQLLLLSVEVVLQCVQ